MEHKEPDLSYLGIANATVNYNLPVENLVKLCIEKGMGKLSSTGALMVDTGTFTGRSPDDRFIVRDSLTERSVDWGKINIPFDADKFDLLYNKVIQYLKGKDLYVRDVQACAHHDFKLNVRVVNELPWQSIFVHNMFIEPGADSLKRFKPNWHVLAAPGFKADPETDGTRQENFAIINFAKRTIIIGGTAYTGEIKKGVFSALNFILPKHEAVLPMHCSANQGENADVAIFFGLSGTGKTTLSADTTRHLIGDDEHGWSNDGIFNFEGGCYAKTIDLSPEGEPEIYAAIRDGALLENVRCFDGTNEVDYSNVSVTPNTRVSYPLDHISNAMFPSRAGIPKNIFFLTFDAFGVLPPISKLTPGQAMYQFISGFTSKVAGTEEGVDEPQVTFSACYGAPFMPLHPMDYARMLGNKLRYHKTDVWLINTGLNGGPYGVGKRIKLKYTRAMIKAALEGKLQDVETVEMPVFGFNIPTSCPGVPSEILNPRSTWSDKEAYDDKLNDLAEEFMNNFRHFEDRASAEVLTSAPQISEMV